MKNASKYLREVVVSYRRTGELLPESGVLNQSSVVADYLRTSVYDENVLEYTESFVVLMLNHSNKVIGYHVLSKGGQTATTADLRVLFSVALRCGATAMVISNNHPSGSLKASQSDKDLTKRVVQAANILDIRVLDHVIVTADSYVSFADEGLI